MKNRKNKVLSLVVSVVALVLVGIAGTVAFLIDQTGPVTNTFTAGTLVPEIVEIFENNVKTDVKIKNNSTVDAYIRANILINWVSSTDSNAIAAVKPIENTDYIIDYEDENALAGTAKWIVGKDGYYYWPDVVEADGETGILLDEVKLKAGANMPEGYQLSVEILSQSIQADGVLNENGTTKYVVEEIWGEKKGGSVTGVEESTLQLKIKTKETGQ